MNNNMSAGGGFAFGGKKILLALPILALLAAGCGSSTTPTVEQTPPSQTKQPAVQSPSPTTTAKPTQAPSATPDPTSVSINISNFAFSPANITIKKGTKITWTNQDGASHTVTGDNGGPASGSLSNGSSYSFTFNQAGTFSYHCAIHPSMTASVTVTR
jgi:plastocyanin